MKIIIYSFIWVSILFVGCEKNEEKSIIQKKYQPQTTQNDSTQKVEEPTVVNREKSFEEFAQEFTKEAQKSKEYFIDNTTSPIEAEYYTPNANGKRDIIRRGTLSNSKYYGYFKWHLGAYSGKKKIEKIGTDRISYKFSDREIMYFLFKKDNDGNWKFYKVISPTGEVEPTIL